MNPKKDGAANAPGFTAGEKMIPLKVLFVEDDRVDQLAFQRFVEEQGLPITYLLAGSLSEAKCLMTPGEFDVIVADYSLGDGTALDLLPFAKDIPLILLTGMGDEAIAARAFAVGVSDYLVKDIGRTYLEQLPARMEKAAGKRMRSAEAMPESEEKFKQLFTQMPSAVALYDAIDDGEDFIFRDFNAAAENIERIKKDDLIGKRVTQIFPGVKDFGIFAVFQRVWRTGQPEFFPSAIYRDQRDPGTWRESWVYKLASGEVVSIYNDVTERKRAEEALQQSEDRFRTSVENMLDAFGIYSAVRDSAGQIVDFLIEYVNAADCVNNRMTREAQIGQRLCELLPAHRETGLFDEYCRVVETGESLRKESLVYQDVYGEERLIRVFDINAVKLGDGFVASWRDITERKQAEEALQQGKERYQALFDRSLDCVYIHDFEGRFLDANDAALNLLGYKREEISDLNFTSLLSEDQLPIALKTLQEIRETGFQKGLTEYKLRLRNGNEVYLETKGSAIVSNGIYTAIQAVARNITERKRAEGALRESEVKYRTLITQSPDGIFIADLKGAFLAVNRIMCENLKYSEEELLSMRIWDIVPDRYADLHKKRIADILMGKAPNEAAEYTVRGKDGNLHCVEILSAPYYEGKKLVGFQGIARDITDRKVVEEALRESEDRYRTLVESGGEGIGIVNPEEQFTFANSAADGIFGLPPGGLLGRSLREFTTPEQYALIREQSDQRGVGEKSVYEIGITRADGKERSILVTAVPQFDGQGQFLATFGVFRDITESKQAEEALRESEERYRRILDLSQEGIWVQDEQFRTTFVNAQIPQWLGYPAEEIVGHPLVEFLFKEDIADHQREMQERKMMIDSQYERRFRRKDGGVVWAIVSAKAISRDDKFQGTFSMLTDITERKKTEEALQKNEALYRLLADNMKDQVWLMDLNLKPTYASPSVEKLRGYTVEEIMQLSLDQQLAPASFQKTVEFFSTEWPRVLADPTYFAPSLELEFFCKDGSTLWLENLFSLIRDENGQPLSLLGVGRDITERKRVEEALQKSEEMYRVLVDNAGEALVVAQDGMLRYVNPKAEGVTGFSQAELMSLAFLELIHPEDRALVGFNYQRRIRGEPTEDAYHFRIVRKDGICKWVEIHAVLISWQGAPATLNFLTDITERKRAEDALVETHEKLVQSLDSTILVLASVAEMRDPYTAGHQQRVSELAQAIAQELGLPEAQVEGIRVAGLLHDVGKMQIPAEILSKPGKLTSVELMLIRTHSQAGYEILKSTVFPWPIAQFVLQHHERCDGSGYPAGLKGEEISLEGRILAVADVVEAMSSHRPYRPAFEAHEALWEILQNKGTLYDVTVAEACQRVFEERRFRFQSQVG